MAQTVSADEFADVQAQLSKDFARLLPRDPAVEVRRWRCCWTGSRTRPTATCDLDAGCPDPPTTKKRPYRIMRPPACNARSGGLITCEGVESRRSVLLGCCPWLSGGH